jgi:hypothetical protein
MERWGKAMKELTMNVSTTHTLYFSLYKYLPNQILEHRVVIISLSSPINMQNWTI